MDLVFDDKRPMTEMMDYLAECIGQLCVSGQGDRNG